MKKKLLILLLIVAVAAFVFAGCTPGGGEGEGEEEVESVVVEILGAVNIGGKDYVGRGTYPITVKLSAPSSTVMASKTDCTGDYSKNGYGSMTPIVLWHNADKTEWSGSVTFDCELCVSTPCVETSPCCANYIIVEVGDCDYCEYYFPYIVDCLEPEVDLQFRFVDCGDVCDPCAEYNAAYLEWRTYDDGSVCVPKPCCADDCSGVAGWVMTIDDDVCAGPCDEIPGTDCPVEGVSDCCFIYPKDTGETHAISYPIKFEIEDNVGNKAKGEWVVEVVTIAKASADKENTPEVGFRLFEKSGSTLTPIDTKRLKGVGNATGWFDIPVSGDCLD